MSEKYDVVIIGAGIGGLVCGCYLAKAGLRVLIVEQHTKSGGCCTSYERKGFRFDVGPHYLRSLREGGILSQVLNELELLQRIKFLTSDPTDRFIMPDRTIFIRRDKNKTKEELISNFPKEKENISRFFDYVLSMNKNFLQVIAQTKKITFEEFLEGFFVNSKLKSILSIPLISIGLPPSRASAIVALVLYKEFIFDGGYYPEGGMQVLPDLLSARFKEYGGDIFLSKRVSKIISSCGKIKGIKIRDHEPIISAKVVVSNADATETFQALLDCESRESKIVSSMKPSISAFIIHLGLKSNLKITPRHFLTGFFSTYDINKCYRDTNILRIRKFKYIFCMFPSLIDQSLVPANKSIIKIFIGADFINKDIWKNSRPNLYKKIIEEVGNVLPIEMEKNIEISEISAPPSFNRFTSNRNGAMFGWEATPLQIDKNLFPPETSIENLYLTGHWVTKGIGQSSVSLVAFCGKSTAKLVLRKIKQ